MQYKQPFYDLAESLANDMPFTFDFLTDLIDISSTPDELITKLDHAFHTCISLNHLIQKYKILVFQLKYGHSVSDSEAICAI